MKTSTHQPVKLSTIRRSAGWSAMAKSNQQKWWVADKHGISTIIWLVVLAIFIVNGSTTNHSRAQLVRAWINTKRLSHRPAGASFSSCWGFSSRVLNTHSHPAVWFFQWSNVKQNHSHLSAIWVLLQRMVIRNPFRDQGSSSLPSYLACGL